MLSQVFDIHSVSVLSQVFDIEFLALTGLKSFELAATEIDFHRTKI